MSFAQDLKNELSILDTKIKKCCSFALIYGMFFSAKEENDFLKVNIKCESIGKMFISICDQLRLKKTVIYENNKKNVIISSDFLRYKLYNEINDNILKCAKCKEYFFRGLFLSHGTMNDPEKSYRLELVFEKESLARDIKLALQEIGIGSSIASRNGKFVVYLRRSESIEDFLAFIGAASLSFEIMNKKIEKEFISNANRATNCDSANINKALQASIRYIDVISKLIKSGQIEVMPEHLKEMAYKRIENKELSITELGKQFTPTISKSGVYHRLEKIVDYYNDLKEKKKI